MTLGPQYRPELPLSNTVRITETTGGDRARSAVQCWEYEAGRQSETGHGRDHVTVDETVLRLDDEQ